MKGFTQSEHPRLVEAMKEIGGRNIISKIIMPYNLRFQVEWPFNCFHYEDIRILNNAGYEVTVESRNKHSLYLHIIDKKA